MKTDKQPLVPGSVVKNIDVTIPVILTKDFARYNSGTICMRATTATFKVPDTGEDGSVGVDLGGTVIDVCFGERSWKISITDIVSAAHDADVAYRAEAPAQPIAGTPAGTLETLDADSVDRLRALVRSGKKIDAIKLARELTCAALKEAKEFVDTL